jgi:thiamine monophosphate synthase
VVVATGIRETAVATVVATGARAITMVEAIVTTELRPD